MDKYSPLQQHPSSGHAPSGSTPFGHAPLVGIDPAKKSFTVGCWDAVQKRTVGTPKTFANKPEGYEAFAAWLEATVFNTASSADANADAANESPHHLIAIEQTGSCSDALALWLHGRGYDVYMVDPRAVWRAFKSEAKTDAIDSLRIAEYAYRYSDCLRPYQPPKEVVEDVRALLTLRERLVEHKTALTNLRGELGARSMRSSGAITVLEETLDHLRAQIKQLEKSMREAIARKPRMATHVEHLCSAPGVRLLMASALLVLTEGFTQRLNPRTLAAYLGIAPHPYQSGTSVGKNSSSRGYGPPIARRLLHLMARTLRTHNDRYKAYFLRKEAEGKPTKIILNNIANKHLRVLCSLVRKRQPYIEGYQSVNPRLLQM